MKYLKLNVKTSKLQIRSRQREKSHFKILYQVLVLMVMINQRLS